MTWIIAVAKSVSGAIKKRINKERKIMIPFEWKDESATSYIAWRNYISQAKQNPHDKQIQAYAMRAYMNYLCLIAQKIVKEYY